MRELVKPCPVLIKTQTSSVLWISYVLPSFLIFNNLNPYLSGLPDFGDNLIIRYFPLTSFVSGLVRR